MDFIGLTTWGDETIYVNLNHIRAIFPASDNKNGFNSSIDVGGTYEDLIMVKQSPKQILSGRECPLLSVDNL